MPAIGASPKEIPQKMLNFLVRPDSNPAAIDNPLAIFNAGNSRLGLLLARLEGYAPQRGATPSAESELGVTV